MEFSKWVMEMSERQPYQPLSTIEVAILSIKTGTAKEFNELYMPQSSDFRDGSEAEGWFIGPAGEESHIYEQVAGSSGVYLIEYDVDGNLVQDDRPWQMTC